MVREVIIVKASPIYSHVRVNKFIEYFDERGVNVKSLCWSRKKNNKKTKAKENFIFFGGGHGGKKLAFYYPIWMLTLFFNVVFSKKKKDALFLVIDFDSAFPVYFASLFRRDVRYVYDIHDDFSKRYRFPVVVNKMIFKLDQYVRRRAVRTIHVDDNRVAESDRNFIVIYNTPKDFFGVYRPPVFNERKTYCVSGLLSYTRGLKGIYTFAVKNPNINFIVAGPVADRYAESFLELGNVEYLGVVEQNFLFDRIKHCNGIFSLYDPSVEINRLAASNKLYDSMMLGIPVIVNKGLQVCDMVISKNLGFVVDFCYNETWKDLRDTEISTFESMSKNCRELYVKKYSYSENFIEKLDIVFSLNNAHTM